MTKLYINPPPQNKCCEKCGKHVNALKPFGKEGDPLVGDFEGFYLVKTFRGMIPYDEKKEKIISEFEIDENIDKKMEEKLGEDKAMELMTYLVLSSQIGPSWECRDCILKD